MAAVRARAWPERRGRREGLQRGHGRRPVGGASVIAIALATLLLLRLEAVGLGYDRSAPPSMLQPRPTHRMDGHGPSTARRPCRSDSGSTAACSRFGPPAAETAAAASGRRRCCGRPGRGRWSCSARAAGGVGRDARTAGESRGPAATDSYLDGQAGRSARRLSLSPRVGRGMGVEHRQRSSGGRGGRRGTRRAIRGSRHRRAGVRMERRSQGQSRRERTMF